MIDSVSQVAESHADLKRTRRKRNSQAAAVDRLPPHSIEGEQALLGCILLSPNEVLPAVIVRVGGIGPAVFYDLRHQTIFEEMCAMFEKMEHLDVITFQQNLKDVQLLEQVGGIAYLLSLQNIPPSAAGVDYYLDIVVEKYVLRKAINTCTDLVSNIYESEGNVDEIMDDFEREAMKIRHGTKNDVIPTMKESVKVALQTIEDYIERNGQCMGIPTGYADFDKMTSGLNPGEMWVIAARPSMGKTSLAMNIAEHVAVDQRLPVGVFSLEMTRDSLVLRILCSRARVSLRNIKDGFLSERDFPKITGTAGKLVNAPIFIDDISGLSIMQLRAKARRMYQQYGIKLFIIDYLQLLHATIGRKRIENRQQEVAEISSGIKALSKELNVPVIVLSQLNRALEKEKNRRPIMADLRESGAIEQDADGVAFLYKPLANKGQEDDVIDEDAIAVNLLIAKQRNGPTGDVHLTFLKNFTRFENAAKVSDEDIPDDRQRTFDT